MAIQSGRWVGRIALFVLLLQPSDESRAEGFDLGLGLAVAGNSDGIDGGWDAQLGYEFTQTESFNLGVQWHWFSGWQGESKRDRVEGLSLRSHAFYLTARPIHANWDWLQLKAGVVNANYRISAFDEDSSTVVVGSEANSKWGLGVGVGLLLSLDNRMRIHVLDVHHFRVGGENITSVGLSFGLMSGSWR